MVVQAVDNVVLEIELKVRLSENQNFIRNFNNIKELQKYIELNIIYDDIKHFGQEKKIIQVDNNPFRERF